MPPSQKLEAQRLLYPSTDSFDGELSACDLDLEPQELRADVFRSRSTIYLVLLTIGLGGLQGVFAIQFSNGSSYLRTLGLSKPVMALVWIVGPVSGAVLQPYFGICSDQCQISWGQRRPFIVFGSLAIIISLLGFAWTEELVTTMTSLLGLANHEDAISFTTAVTAIVFVSALNVAIQPVQGGLRTLIVDNCPAHQQNIANAWAGRIIGTANVVSYLCAFGNLPQLLPFFGKTQFQVLSALVCAALAVTVAITCWAVKEKDPGLLLERPEDETNISARLWYLCTSYPRLPPQVQVVCQVQFLAWMGWFPFLFYITTYVGDNYTKESSIRNATSSSAAQAIDEDDGIRAASLGLVLFSVTSVVAGTVLPLFAHSQGPTLDLQKHATPRNQVWRFFQNGSMSMNHMWMVSHILFAVCMFATVGVSTLYGNYVLLGLVGVSRAVTAWAPFAIISNEISSSSFERLQMDRAGTDERYETRPGIVLGLHNVAVALPQILAAVGSSIIFWISHHVQTAGHDDSIGWVLRFGGLSSLGAAYLCRELRDGHELVVLQA